jgi:hypothetical protein
MINAINARSGSPLTELAQVAWNNAQLYDDEVAEMNGLLDAAARMRQIRLLTVPYALPAADRRTWRAGSSISSRRAPPTR